MGFGFVAFVAGAAAAGYMGYRKLVKIEEEIREELASKGMVADQEESPPPKKSPAPAPDEEVSGPASLEDRLLDEIRKNPGMLQTDLYTKFSDKERKAVQAALLKMDKAGTIRRTKEKSTYALTLS